MHPMQALTPLGALFRRRRGPMGWDRVEAQTGLKRRGVRTYESGGVMPPLDKALILAEFYGIALEELAEVVLGRPYEPRRPTPGPPEAPASGEPRDEIADAASVLPARPRERRPGRRPPSKPRASRPSPDG